MTDDLLLINGLVRTMDPGLPQTDAVLIRGGRIAALGQAAREARAQVIDLGGRLVLPGFQDAHIHLLNGGTRLVEAAQLYEADTIAALQASLAAHAATWPGPVLRGVGWHFGLFGDHNLTRQVIDAVVPDRPCVIFDANLHNACLNSAAIALIGLGDETPDPPNGHIVRDATGRATGMLHEAAVGWASAALPRTDAATLDAGLRAGQSLANRHGITGIIDPCIRSHHVTTYGAAAAAGRLTLRVAGASLIRDSDTPETALARLTARRAAHSGPDFQLNAAKVFLDGVLENRTAALLASYADGPGGNAPLMFPPDRIAALFTALDAARFQIHVHCIGDAATRATLDGLAAARAANGAWPALHQIAHVQVLDPADIPRFAALGVMANMQPLWAAHDPVTPEPTWAMIGPARLPFTYPFRSLVDAGAPFCVSSDWAVSTLNPFEIIGTAVTREPPRARGRAEPFLPHQRLSVAQAVQGYTTHAAAACWRADFTGRIRPGFSGDLIVLDRDIFTCDPYAIAETRVLLTLFKGRPVHRAEDFP